MKNLCQIIFLVFSLLSLNILAQSINDYRSKQTGDWSNASTWQVYSLSGWIDASTPPSNTNGIITIQNGHTVTVSDTRTADQVVVASGGTLTVSGYLSIADETGTDLQVDGTLNLSGNLKGAGQVVVNNVANWTGGAMEETGTTSISSGATLNISGSSGKLIQNGRSLINAGTINWTGGDISFYATGIITNQSGANFYIKTDNGFVNAYGGGTKKIDNAGTMTKNTTAGTTTSQIELNNSGSLVISTGTFSLSGGGTQTGSFNVASSCTLNFASTVYLGDGVNLTGGGTYQITAYDFTLNGTTTGTSVASGTTFNFSGGGIKGNGHLTINGTMNWTTGTMDGAGTITIASGATLNISGTGSKGIATGRNLVNSGTIYWTGGNISFYATGIITNQSGANFYIQCDQTFVNDYGTGTRKIDNAGTMTKNTTAGTTTSQIELNNSGSLVISTGTLTLNGGGTQTGSFSVASSCTLNFASTVYVGDGVNLTGGGTYQATANDFTLNGTTTGTSVASGTTFNLTNGNIKGNGHLTINGVMNWTGGSMEGAGTTTISSSGSLTISETNNKSLSNGRNLVNSGTIYWTGGNITFTNTGILTNQSGANFYIQCDQTFVNGLGTGTRKIDNAGTMTKNTTTGTTTSQIELNNTGTITISAGTLSLGGTGTNSGSISVASGATLTFSNNYTLDASSNISGAGISNFSGGTVNITGTYSLTGTVNVSGGTVNFNSAASIGTLNLSSGTLGGTGTVTISSGDWSGGTMTGSGTTSIPSGSTLTISGSSKKYLYSNRTLNNSGTVNWTGGNIGCNISTISNNNNANFNIQSDAYIENDGGTSTFENNGTVTKSTNTGVTIIYIVFNNNSTGSVIANSGTIRFDGNGTHACNFTAASGAVIGFNAGTHTITMSSSSTITGAGKFQISGATVTISGTGTYSVTTTEVTGGTATFNRDISPTNLTVSGGTLGGSGNISVSSTFTWSGGTITGSGTFEIPNGATATLSSSSKTLNGRTVNLKSGSVTTWTGGNIALTNNASINNEAGSVFNGQSTDIMSQSSGGSFINNGTYNQTGGNSTISATFTNNNKIDVQSGKLYLSALTNFSNKKLTGGTYEITGTLKFADRLDINEATIVMKGSGAMITYGEITEYDGLRYFSNNNSGATFTLKDGYSYTTNPDNYATTLTNEGTLLVDVGGIFTQTKGNSQQYTITGSGLLQIKGTFNWNGGTQTGGGTTQIDAGGVLNIGTSYKEKYIANRTFNNSGTINLTSNYFHATGSTGIINNQSSGVFDIQGDYYLSVPSYSDMVTFNNSGLVKKSSGTGTAYFGERTNLNNNGTVLVQSGTLELQGGGTSTGSFQANSGAVLNFRYGNHIWNAGVTLTGEGTIKIEPTSEYGNSYITINNDVILTTGATLSLGNRGYLQGTGELEVHGTMNFSGGYLTGGGKLEIKPNAVMNIPDNYTKYLLDYTINNYGTINVTGSNHTIYTSNTQNAVINNYASGLFDIKATSFSFSFSNYTDIMAFNNYGTLRRSAGTGNFTFGERNFLYNYGTVDIQTGNMILDGSSTSTGSYQIANGCYIQLRNSSHYWNADVTVSGNGTYKLSGANEYINVILFINSTTNGAVINQGATLEVGYQSRIDGAGKLIIKGTLLGSMGGRFNGTGITQIDAGGVMNLTAGIYTDDRTFNNYGTINFQNGYLIGYDQTTAVINNYASGVMDAKTDGTILKVYETWNDELKVYNYGLLKKTAGTGNSTVTEKVKFYNYGTIEVQTGTLWIYELQNYNSGTNTLSGGKYQINNSTFRFGASGSQTITSIDAEVLLSGSNAQILNYNGTNAIPAISTVTSNGKLTFQNGKDYTISVASFTNNGTVALDNANITLSSSTTFHNYGTLNCGKDLVTGAGNFIMYDNSTLGVGHADGIVTSGAVGNIQNTGTRTYNANSSYVYYGGETQVTGNALPASIPSFTVNKSAGSLTLANNLVAQNSFTLTNGIINTGSNTLTLGTGVGNTGTLSYTAGRIIGNFKRWFAASTVNNVLFPVGTTANNRPANISFTSAPTTGGTITATFVASNPGSSGLPLDDGGTSIVNVGQDGYWQLNAGDGLAGGTYNLDLTAEGFSGITNYQSLRLLKRANSSSNWTLEGTHSACTGSNEVPTVHRVGLTSFSEFGIGSSSENPLPVELISLSAIVKEQVVELEWQTSTEVNNYGFEVERTSPLPSPSKGEGGKAGRDWQKLGFVQGYGNRNAPKTYTFTDNSAPVGKIQYRLKQIDNDGSFKYSDVIEVNVEAPAITEVFQNYPNPFNPSTSIKFNLSKESKVKIVVYDILGSVVKELVNEVKPAGSHIVYWNSDDNEGRKVASGVYFYRLEANALSESSGQVIQIKKMNLVK